MSTWGSTAIYILVGSLKPGITAPVLTEIDLLPNPSDLAAITTVIQQQGRKRQRVKAKLYFEALNDYDILVSDYHAGISKTLTDAPSGLSGMFMIENMGEPEFVQDNCVFADITWVEVP